MNLKKHPPPPLPPTFESTGYPEQGGYFIPHPVPYVQPTYTYPVPESHASLSHPVQHSHSQPLKAPVPSSPPKKFMPAVSNELIVQVQNLCEACFSNAGLAKVKNFKFSIKNLVPEFKRI